MSRDQQLMDLKKAYAEQATAAPVHDFTAVKTGDTVIRMLGGKIRIPMEVTAVDADLIHTRAMDTGASGWTFDRKTGVEVDEDLEWGPKWGRSGSFLAKDN